MNIKFLGLVLLLGAGAYYYHHKEELMPTDIKSSASASADNIAFAQGWIDDSFDTLNLGVTIGGENAPTFELIKDDEVNGQHTTTGRFTYFPIDNGKGKCKLITFTWHDRVGSKEEKLLSHTGC